MKVCIGLEMWCIQLPQFVLCEVHFAVLNLYLCVESNNLCCREAIMQGTL